MLLPPRRHPRTKPPSARCADCETPYVIKYAHVETDIDGNLPQQPSQKKRKKDDDELPAVAAVRKTIEEIISGGENNTTEFKSTLPVNLHTQEPDPKIEHAALKTIAAFLNSREGGILVIGIKDDREALGVEADGFPNEDKMNLHLVNLIKARLGAASMLNIKPHFEDYKGKRLLVVDCLSSSSPVYLKNGNTEEFYIRAGASSAALAASEMTNYIQQRYN